MVALFLAFPTYSQDKEEQRENRLELVEKKKKDKKPFFKTFYNNFFKYATIYGAGDYRAPYESSDKKYLIRQPEGAGLYDVPIVDDVTEYFQSDYIVGFIPDGVESKGTNSTLKYAKKFDKKTIIID